MEKQLIVFAAFLVLQVAVPTSSGSPTFDEWLAVFDPLKAVSKSINCFGKPNGFYPGIDPETTCSATYTACVSNNAYPQNCVAGEVFDSTPTVRKCVIRNVAQSAVCENPYPAPACTADNLGEFQPTDKCSDLFYVCLRNNPTPQFEYCVPGLPTNYFDPISGACQKTAGAKACEGSVDPPAKVPGYGCGADKITGYAYAITECSVSFYTCNITISASPIPGSCTTTGGAGTVFNYRAKPALPSKDLCVLKSTVAECT